MGIFRLGDLKSLVVSSRIGLSGESGSPLLK